jgi:hypothetical protein
VRSKSYVLTLPKATVNPSWQTAFALEVWFSAYKGHSSSYEGRPGPDARTARDGWSVVEAWPEGSPLFRRPSTGVSHAALLAMLVGPGVTFEAVALCTNKRKYILWALEKGTYGHTQEATTKPFPHDYN